MQMPEARRRFERLEIAAALTLVVVSVTVFAAFQFIFGRDPEQPFRDQEIAKLGTIAAAPPASLRISFDGGTDAITNPAQIAQFLRLLVEPPVVPRHHSHPENLLGFQLQASSATYILSRDSQEADEYWLELEEGTDPARTIKLFHSEALTSWLEGEGLLER